MWLFYLCHSDVNVEFTIHLRSSHKKSIDCGLLLETVVVILSLTVFSKSWMSYNLSFSHSTPPPLNSGLTKHIKLTFSFWLESNKWKLNIDRIERRYFWTFQSPAPVIPIPPITIHQLLDPADFIFLITEEYYFLIYGDSTLNSNTKFSHLQIGLLQLSTS